MFDSIAIFLAQYFFIVVVVVAAAYLVLRYRPRLIEMVITALIIGGTAYLLSKVGNSLIASPRPFIVTGKPPLIHSSTDNGFPSDHTLLIAAIGAIVSHFNLKAGLLVWGLALLIGLCRVYVGVHHLIDVAGSLVIVLIAWGVFALIERVWRAKRPASPEPVASNFGKSTSNKLE